MRSPSQSVMAANLSRKLKVASPTSQEEWTIRERLILASSVVRSGDQNWVSVSRTVKPIAESGFGLRQRPPDFFSQKSCAAQYSEMLEKVSTPKRKRTSEGGGTETPGEQIVRSLTFERIDELRKLMKSDQLKYRRAKAEIEMIMSGKCDEALPKFLEGIQRPKSAEVPGFVNQREMKPPQLAQPIVPTSTSVTATQQPLKSPVPSSPKKHKNLRIPKPTERFKEFQQEQQARHSHSSPAQVAQQQHSYQQQQQFKQLQQKLEFQHLQQKMQQQQQQQMGQQKQMAIEQHLVKTSPKIIEQAGLQEKMMGTNASQPPPRQFFRAESQPDVMLQQQQHQPQQQTFPSLSDSSQSYLAQLVQSTNNDHSIKRENTAMSMDLSFEKQAKISPKTKKSSISLENIAADQAALNHGPAPLSSHLPASSGLLSTLLAAPVKDLKHVAKTINQSSLEQDQNENLQHDQSCGPGVPFLDAANPAIDVPKVESVREKTPGGSLSASEVAPTLSKLLTTTVVGNGKASSHNEMDSVQKKEGTAQQHEKQEKFEEDFLTKKNASMPVSKSIKEEGSRSRKSSEESGLKDNVVRELGERSNTMTATKALAHADVTPKPEKRRPGRPRTRKPPKEPEYMEDEIEEEISKEPTVKRDFNIKIERDLEETDSEERFKKTDDLEDLKKEEKSEPSVQSSFGSESIPDSPASQISQSGSDDLESLQAQKNWKKSIMLVWRAAANHKYANVFLHPVTDDEAPGYHNVIYRPMDLSTIKKNIESGVIRTTSGFQRDMMLMFQNALMYNSSDHDVYRMAEEMREDVMDQIQSYIATQLMVQSDRESKMLRGHKTDVFHFSL